MEHTSDVHTPVGHFQKEDGRLELTRKRFNMVKAEETSPTADRWKEVFDRSRLVPPSSHTSRLAAESHLSESRGFQLSLSRVTAAHLPQEVPEDQDVSYQLRATLFDGRHQQFFGKTWKSSPQRLRNSRISFNEVLYFHTLLRIPSTVLVVELVELTLRADSSHQAVGRGFTVLELFSPRAETVSSGGDQRLNLHQGSPRSLLHPLLKDTTDYGSLLRVVDGAHLDCAVKSHPSLASALHLFPENVLVSGDESIPGLVDSPTGGALLKPQLLHCLPFTLNSLTISLKPSLESFEGQLLQLVNADCHNTKQPGGDDALRTVVIQERRLHVGVHNGWAFLERPQVVVLEAVPSAGSRGRSLDKDSSASQPQKLALRSSLQLKLINHPALAIVFQLEYVFSAPIGRETMLSATTSSRAAFLQSLRWGVWCPFHQSSDWREGEIRLVLQGGAMPNPHHFMVYRTEMAKTPDSEQASEAKDNIRFHLSSGRDRKASGSKLSLRPQENTSPSSPSRGQRMVPAVSPPDSPPGPGLSLSQLAATSRYPSISHFSSASPWQHSSLLHPSPLAPAHQLSHGVSSAVSTMAHLEIDLGPGSPPAPDEGPLQELPFTPVHAPVLTLGVNVPSSFSGSSRSSVAHLHSAGLPEVLDCTGQTAEVLDPSEPMPFDPQREETDPLQGNLLVLQFLAFTRIPGLGMGPDCPKNVYFTFQFYRFPPVTSQSLTLLSQERRADPLCLLTTINRDGTVNSASPGLQLQFRVDQSFLKPGEKRWFLRYLALHSLHIDVWDSDSLLLLGSTAIQLKYMLRQGKAAVQALHELEVLTTDYMGEGPLGTSEDRGATCHLSVHTVVRGRLHVRTGNIGCPVDPDQQRAVDTPQSHIIIPHEVTGGFRGGSLSSRNILQLNARNSAQAQRLQSDRPIRTDLIRAEQTEDGHRKLSCMAAVHGREGTEHALMPKVTDSLHVSSPGVEQSKAEAITNMLSQTITTQHRLFSSLGSAEYMEYVLRNPFNIPHTVTVCSDDPQLCVITSAEEWRYFKSLTHTPTPVEENMFHLDPGAPGPRVFLRPKESLHIPLKYQSFLCEHTTTVQGPSFLPAGRSSQVAKKNPSNIAVSKTIKVTFSAEDGQPLAILQVNVEPTPHVVDQTFRLYHPEQSFLKKAIRLPPWDNPSGGELGDGAQVTVRCSDHNVICQTRKTMPGEPQDVYLKVPGSPSPHVRMFFVMVFTDKWLAAPSQVWQVYVHFLERMDLSCVSGQRSCQSLVLRGKQAVRKLRCFCSHPQELQVDPEGVFVLPPAAVQEIQVKVQPWRAGSRFFYISAVDVEQHRLVSSWLLCLSVHRPVLSKAFEVSVPVGGGRGSSRKISYTNPYSGQRSFLLRSDHPDLLQFREDAFQIGGGETYTIGLRFAPSQHPGTVEILVYVNDLEEKTEETFCVKVDYS